MAAVFGKDDEIALLMRQRTKNLGWQGHVLIVDDEPNFRFATGIALRRAGYAITEAENAKEALRLILEVGKGQPFDLLLVDIQMPGMSGVELVSELNNRNIAVPILIVSGFADNNLMEELCTKGCIGLLQKPFDPGELIERVRSALNGCKNGGECPCPT